MNIFSFISSEAPDIGNATFRAVTILFSTPENLLVWISEALGMKESQWTPLGTQNLVDKPSSGDGL